MLHSLDRCPDSSDRSACGQSLDRGFRSSQCRTSFCKSGRASAVRPRAAPSNAIGRSTQQPLVTPEPTPDPTPTPTPLLESTVTLAREPTATATLSFNCPVSDKWPQAKIILPPPAGEGLAQIPIRDRPLLVHELGHALQANSWLGWSSRLEDPSLALALREGEAE